MTIVRTDLGITRESARRERFEPTGNLQQTNVQKAIEEVATNPPGLTETAVSASPYNVLSTDNVLAVDSSIGPITINLGLAAARGGRDLVIKDVGGAASANAITINRAGADTFEGGGTSVQIITDFGGYRLRPRSVSWVVSP